MRLSGALLVTALIATTSACGTVGQGTARREATHPSTTAPASSSPSLTSTPPTATSTTSATDPTAPSVGTPAEARRKLARAVARELAGSTTTFRAEIRVSDRLVQETTGYSTRNGDWDAQTLFSRFENLSDRTLVASVSVGDTVWAQHRTSPDTESTCWTRLPSGYSPGGIPALGPGQPAYVTSLSQLDAVAFAGDPTESQITARLPLTTVLAFLDSTILDTLDDRGSDWTADEVEVTVLVVGSNLYDYVVSGHELVSTLRKAGVKTSDAMYDYLRSSEMKLIFAYRSDDRPVPQPPSPGHVVSAGSKTCPDTNSA